MKNAGVRRVIFKITRQTKALLPFPGFFANVDRVAIGVTEQN